MKSLVTKFASLVLVFACSTGMVQAQLPGFDQPLAGDQATGLAAGDQNTPFISRGDGAQLLVWTDDRANPYVFYEYETATDIYGVRLDDNQNSLDAVPFAISAAPASQSNPKVAWNGTDWLVVFETNSLSGTGYYYNGTLAAVRVAADGTIRDAEPIPLFGFVPGSSGKWDVASDGNQWVVVAENNRITTDIFAMRIAADGTVLDAPTQSMVEGAYYTRFGIRLAYSGGVFLLTFDEQGQTGAVRFDSNLNLLDTQPFILLNRTIADLDSNGTDFYIAWNQQRPDFTTVVSGSRVSTAGALLDGNGVEISGNFPMQGFDGGIGATWDTTNWRVSWPNAGSTRVARVSEAGQVLEPGGVALAGVTAGTTAGTGTQGVQFTWAEFVDNEYDIYAATADINNSVIANEGVSLSAPRQNRADLAAGDSGYMAVYRSVLAGQVRILAQPLDAAGASQLSQPILLDSGTGTSGPGSPAVAWNGSLFLVSWSSSAGIVAKRVLQDGTVMDANPILIMNPGFGAVDVAAVGDDFLVAGFQFGFSIETIFPIGARVRGSDGLVLDAEPLLLSSQTQSPFTTYARTLALTSVGDRWLAAWHTNATHDDTFASTIASFIDTSGLVSAPFLLEYFSTAGGNFIFSLGLASNGSSALMVQSAELTSGVETDLLAHVINADGTIGPRINLTPWVGNQYRPEMSFNGTDYVLVYQDQKHRQTEYALEQLDARGDLYGMRISPDGTVIDPQGFLIANSPIGETDPVVASRGSDTLILASQMLNDGVHSSYRVLVSEVLGGTNRFPVAMVNAPIVTGDVPLTVDFSSAGSVDPEGSALTYLWQFADGGISSEENPVHQYTQPGAYPALLTVMDELGQAANQEVLVSARAPNQLPIAVAAASVTSGPAPLSVIFYADGSYDPDGQLGNIEWRQNGSLMSYNPTAYYTFANDGTYEVTLRVYDSRGDFGEAPPITITVGGPNQPPVAQASATPISGQAPLSVSFSSSGSSDTDGSIVDYHWDFGDGSSGSGSSPSHLYTSQGVFPVLLTVTDNSGASDTASLTVTVDGLSAASLQTAINMSSRKKRGVVNVNAVVAVTNGLGGTETSAIVQGKWTLPDSSTLTRTQYSDNNGNATFSTAAVGDGVYIFEIYSVTKSGFAWDKAGSETVASFSLGDAVVNRPPTALFSEICTQLSCSFNGSGSSDSDGSIVSWSWSFGDGGSGSGVNATHDYSSAGNYTVTLTVTDDQGASDSSSHPVTVNDTPNPPVTVHVGDLDGNATAAARNRWVASVSIQLHKANDDPAAGVTVSGNWSNGANGSDSCVTAEDGRCTISKANLKSNVSSVMFTVNDAVKANTSYDSAANHDPEADSNGTSIMINR